MTEAPAAVAPELNGQPAAAAATVEVKLGETTLKVDKATADALTAFQKSVNDAGALTTSKLADLEKQLAKLAPKPVTNSDPNATDIDQLLFTNPKKALELVGNALKAEILGEINKTQQQDAFWKEFYRQNKDLEGADLLVKAVMGREFETLKPMNGAAAIAHLSKATKAEILKLGGNSPRTNKANEVEGGNENNRERSNATEVSESSPPVASLSGELARRRAARRAGASK